MKTKIFLSATLFALLQLSTSAHSQEMISPKDLPPVRPQPPLPPPGRLPEPPRLELPNWDFELGLSGWEKTGNAFDFQPTYGDNVKAERVTNLPVGGNYWRTVFYPIGHRGSKWIGTYEQFPNDERSRAPRGHVQGDRPVGTLTSKPFVLNHAYLTFLIAGGNDLANLRVEVLEKTTSKGGIEFPDGRYRVAPGKIATGHGSELMRREHFDLTAFRGKTLRVRIVDNASGHWGHINVDDFRFTDVLVTPPPGPEGFVRDSDAPLFGFADMHTHPASHLGFGRKLMHGAPDGDIASALGNCNCTHGGWGLDNGCGNHIRAAVVNIMDELFIHKTSNVHGDHQHDGYPDFTYWPHFTSFAHQQMWHEWIRRAYDGGLRVMVALAVNNHLLAEAIDGDAPKTDKESADLQIEEMKRFVHRHREYMEIAYNPSQMRRIVRENKLAVILGIEVDNIGNFNFANVSASKASVRAEIARLFANGVRYIFPIHVTDNKFGGAAVYNDLFNLANRFAKTQPLPPEFGAWVPGQGFQIEHADDPAVRYQLKPHMEAGEVVGIRAVVEALEGLPYPFPFETFPPSFTWGARLNNESEYRVVKSFFLTPDPSAERYKHIPPGHRNIHGLTPLGEFALKEMMRLGMIIDIDHMSEKSANRAIELMRGVPDGGYPVNSGHNGFRAMGHSNENGRSDAQLEAIVSTGGMMGVGFGYGKSEGPGTQVEDVLRSQGASGRFTRSAVRSNCGGTSRVFANSYLYAVEKVGAVAIGTDMNGMVSGPGPRFGDLSRLHGNYCEGQNWNSAVRYTGASGVLNPLTKLRTGNKEWDINTEGVAHYGLLPDFLQDVKNVGVQAEDLSPLFRGADSFARMWEKSVSASRRVGP